MLNGFVTAIRTLTILPVPGREAEARTSALPWFPLVGFIVGLIVYGICRVAIDAGFGKWPEAVGVVAVISVALLTRGLHMDGLADWADGFWGGKDKDDVLRIMKDPRIGSFGIIAMSCDILARWVAVTRLAEIGGLEWIIVACVISRAAQVAFIVGRPYAGNPGGMGASFVEGATYRHLLWSLVMAPVILSVALLMPHWLWVACIAAGWLFARLFGAVCRKRIGGITGDLIGACSEMVEIGILMFGAVL